MSFQKTFNCRIHARNHSYPTETSAEELPILPTSLAQLSQPLDPSLEEDVTEDGVFEQNILDHQPLLAGQSADGLLQQGVLNFSTCVFQLFILQRSA